MLQETITNDDRIQREKDFHNQHLADGNEVRRATDKYYTIAGSSTEYYKSRVAECSTNNRLLEYGCGTGTYSIEWANIARQVVGIDISEEAVRQATEALHGEHPNVEYHVMNAEHMDFPDASFDVICGTSILHHLDLDQSYSEIARVLSPNGRALFYEPLGYNPIINLYRRLTPKMRTEDEHPLMMRDIKLAEKYFHTVKLSYFHLASLATVPLRNMKSYPSILKFAESTEQFMMRVLPFLKPMCWVVVIELDTPRK